MNQHEVMELMQRHLDNDLTDKELDLLMDYMNHDQESKEMFERMQLLSGDLANLPRVSPPQSIVDSILPELDRLEQEKQTISQPVHRPRKTKWVWQYSGGIVAAAAIIGLFIFYGDLPEQHPDAGELIQQNNMALDEVAIFKEEDQDQLSPMIMDAEESAEILQDEKSIMNEPLDESMMRRTVDEEADDDSESLSFIYEEPVKEEFVAPDEPHHFPPLTSPDEDKVVYLLLKEDGWYLKVDTEAGEPLAEQGPIYAEQMMEWIWSEDSDKVSARFNSGEQDFWFHLELP